MTASEVLASDWKAKRHPLEVTFRMQDQLIADLEAAEKANKELGFGKVALREALDNANAAMEIAFKAQDKAEADRTALLAAIRQAVEAMELAEFVVDDDADADCPVCGTPQGRDHAKTCEIGNALAACREKLSDG